MILQGNSSSIAQKSSGIWTVQADLQPISFKSDRLLGSKTTLNAQLRQHIVAILAQGQAGAGIHQL